MFFSITVNQRGLHKYNMPIEENAAKLKEVKHAAEQSWGDVHWEVFGMTLMAIWR